jgi:adenylate cyclase
LGQADIERRLTTVLVADIVGYSRLMAADEAGTLARLKADRRDLIEPKAAAYRGRVVKLIGDGTLMEFASVVDAVNFAVDVQQEVARRDRDAPDDRRLTYRIGINIGDIIADGDDIYGDGVNVAARLEGLAVPGGICVSGAVHAQVKGKVELDFEDRGEQAVKNIPEPVRVFHFAPGGPTSAAAATPPTADKPSIAVLPFTNMSGDPEQEYFADGISEDVTTDLSKIAGLFVIARNSAFAYKGRTPDIRRVCRELGVRYVLEGSVRKAGSRVRINAQMIVRRDGRGKVDPEAYDCLLRGRECLNRMSAASLAESRAMLLRAIDLDPGLAAAYATLSIVHITEHLNKWNDAGPDHLERALAFARQACEANSHDTHAFYALAHSQMWLRNMDEAERAAQQALDLDPNFAGAFAALGLVRDYTGRHADALGLFEQALKLDPQYGMALQYLGRAQFALEHYEDAERTFTRRLIHAPHSDMTRAFLASLYGHTGRVEEARRLWREVLEINPDFSVERIRRSLPYQDPAWFDRYADGLSKAGLLD